MLRRFIYLDSDELSAYLSAFEGGERMDLAQRSLTKGSAEGAVDAKVVKGGGSRTKENEESVTLRDTAGARFERLMKLVKADPEEMAWLEVLDADNDLETAGFGTMVEVEAEIYVPDLVNALANTGDIERVLAAMDTMAPIAELMGLDMNGLPDRAQRDAAKGFTSLGSLLVDKIVVVGDLDNSEWRVAGQLRSDLVDGQLEGMVRIVGKIAKRWSKGTWKPILALPGTTLLPRDKRRKLEQKRPKANEIDNYLEGPAVMLDVLAIYR